MPLLTIDDLTRVSSEEKKQYVKCAMQLSRLYHTWKAQHDGKMVVNVEFFGERDRAQGVHASELSGCQRKFVYALMGVPRIVLAEQKDVNMQRRFDMGTMVHALTQKEFHLMCEWYNATQTPTTGMLITFEDEVSISPELGGVAALYHMHSSCDGRFTFWQAGYDAQGNYAWVPFMRVGHEIKTASGPAYKKIKEPAEGYVEQTCMYMRALDIPLMWMQYIDKSTQYYTGSEAPYLYQYPRILWEKTLEPRIISKLKMASEGKLPAREEGLPCGWCPFAHTCGPRYLKSGRKNTALPPGAL